MAQFSTLNAQISQPTAQTLAQPEAGLRAP